MKYTILTLALFTLLSCKTKKDTEQIEAPKIEDTMELSNKEKVVALLNSFNTGDQTPISYINPEKYIQHNLAVGDGLAGFGEVMQHAPEGGFKANVVRAFQDGDYVITHTEYDFFGPKIGFDVFKFENGLITEHWDNLTAVTPANPSGRTQIDGTTAYSDLDKTEVNKTLVKNFISDILVKGEMSKVGNYIDSEDSAYLQHNSAIADGLSSLGKALEDMAKQGIIMEYKTIHKILGEGNFVLAISEGNFGGVPTSFYDLFRVNNEKIVEHWDIIETIIPEAQRKNTNGKFNF